MRTQPLSTALQNIDAIARLEQDFLEQRTFMNRVGDAIGAFVGTMTFVVIHVVALFVWIVWNLAPIPDVHPFDPFPFMLLAMVVSIEGVLLTTFVLMKQNRMSKRADQRNQLNLQIDMLSEREVTKILQMLTRVCDHMGLQDVTREPELRQLSQDTSIDLLAQELKKKMPE